MPEPPRSRGVGRGPGLRALVAGLGLVLGVAGGAAAQDAGPAGRNYSQIYSSKPRLSFFDQILRDRDDAGTEEPETPDLPGLTERPIRHPEIPVEDQDPFFLPFLSNLLYESSETVDDDPARGWRERLRRRSRVNIRFPGPDTANFPNSAFTLPKGRFYLENSPFSYYAHSATTSPQYNWEFLLRYGLTDNVELRLFSNGYTVQRDPRTTGFSPLAFDFKIHLWDENPELFVPALGLEVYLQTNFGSRAFNNGTQPSMTLNFDTTLPYKINFEYNFGVSGSADVNGEIFYQFSFQFAFQKEILPGFAIFTQGFYNAASLPRIPGVKVPKDFLGDDPAVVVGGGFIWHLSDRLSLYGSYNGGLNQFAPATISYLGFAIAF